MSGVSFFPVLWVSLAYPLLVYYQEQIVKRVTMSIQRMAGTPGHQLTRRPFQVTWFSNQLAL